MNDLTVVKQAGDKAIAAVADKVASKHTFNLYRRLKAPNTLARQADDLRCFETYLSGVRIQRSQMDTDPGAWAHISFGLVMGFVEWLRESGYAIGTINARLSTVKVYASLAMNSGTMAADEVAKIRAVHGYRGKEGARIDKQREHTRVGWKKAKPTGLTRREAERLRTQPDTPQGRRDAVLVAIFLDLGLRCGEVAPLTVESISLPDRTITFWREKVNFYQTHRLTSKLEAALKAYFESGDGPKAGPLLRSSHKDGTLGKAGMSKSAILKRIRKLGKAAGVWELSPHDLRHYWSTEFAKHHPFPVLQQAGGWSGPEMPMSYIDQARIANEIQQDGFVVESDSDAKTKV